MLAEFKTAEAPTAFMQVPNNWARKTAKSTAFAAE
jgi:hypothetical protein